MNVDKVMIPKVTTVWIRRMAKTFLFKGETGS